MTSRAHSAGAGVLADSGRGLTLRWPWLSTLLSGERPIELRRRPPPAQFVGRWFWLHCSSANGRQERVDAEQLEAAGVDTAAARGSLGHIVGRARLGSARKLVRQADGWAVCGPAQHVPLRWRWVDDLLPEWVAARELWMWSIEDVDPIEPVGPVRGQLGFWRLSGDAARTAAQARVCAVRRAVYAALDDITWELGPLRQEGEAWTVGQPGGVRLRVNLRAGVVEATRGNRLERRADLVTAACFTRAIDETIALVRGVGGVRNCPGSSAPVPRSIEAAATAVCGQ